METAKGSFSLEVMDPDNISGWRDEDPYFGSEKRGKNIILYDWFAMTSKVDSVESLLNQLGLKTSLPFKETKGFYGYRSRLKFDGISIYYDYCYKDTDYPLLELTGQGCRDYETYTDGNWGRLFQLALDTDNYHVTRLDVAYDDHEGILDINKIVRKTEKRHFVSRSQVGTITNSFDRDKDAYSVMYGGRSSELYCRIYDKALERGYSDGRHWVRCETVFKGDRAYNFIKNDDPIGAKYCGVLKNYIRFVEPNENDSNKRRWNVSKWWDKFLGDCKRISVCSPKTVDYNLSRVGRYVFHQAGNCVDTYIQCVGIIQFLNELKVRDTVLTPHQKRLIDEYKARIAAENNNCNTNTAAAAPVDDEENNAVRELLTKDLEHMESIQSELSNSRQFYLVYRFRNQSKDLVGTIVSRLEKCMSEYDFVCKRLEKSDLKQFLAVYFGISSYGAEIADVEGATNENM